MYTDEREFISVREFIDLILETKIAEAGDWVGKFRKSVPNWQGYSSQNATSQAVQSISFGISDQITRDLKNIHYVQKKSWQELAKKGHAFLKEVFQKALELGLEVEIGMVDWVFEPEMQKSV